MRERRFDRERTVRADFAKRRIEPVLAALRREGLAYSVVRKLPDGAWGAWLVEDRQGARAVVKCIWDVDWRPRLASAERVVDILLDRGARVPRYLATGHDSRFGTWYLQDYLDGDRARTLTRQLLADVSEFIGLQADGAPRDEQAFDWSLHVRRAVYGNELAWRRVLRSHSPETAAIADDLSELIEPCRNAPLDNGDIVHGDFLATQLLTRAGRLAGVLDWDAAGRGDRGQDLALLLYNAFAQADRLGARPDAALLTSLVRQGVGISGAAFGLYLAYEALDALTFVIEHNARHVQWRTSLAARALELYRRVTTTS